MDRPSIAIVLFVLGFLAMAYAGHLTEVRSKTSYIVDPYLPWSMRDSPFRWGVLVGVLGLLIWFAGFYWLLYGPTL